MEQGFNKLQIHNFCFTAYTEPKLTPTDLVNIQYMIYQKEKCPSTGRIHWQGYCELKIKKTPSWIKKTFDDNTLHIAIRRGSQAQAIAYCEKSPTQLEKPIRFGKPKIQGARSDLDEMTELAKSTSIKTLIDLFGGNALRHINMIRRYQEMYYKPDSLEIFLRQNEGTEMTDNQRVAKFYATEWEDKANDLGGED